MEKTNGRIDESILVCVHYGPNGERLIKRGCKIANMLGCPLYILTVDTKPFDEMDAEKSFYLERWKQLAEENNVTDFIIKDREKRPVAKVITDVAREKHVTQIVLGQTAQSRWEQITKGSLINTLLHDIPFVDLHIISVTRYIRNENGQFQRGCRAYLSKEDEHFRLTFKHSNTVDYEGIFFKEQGTDFDNGIFKFMKDREMFKVRVTEGIVKELKKVDMNVDYEHESKS
ncbi:universal stress protein [Ornithinibacillus californiensis]|uniref:universal stress protein n=1 Tax=Ornithinibacillus californiensis TaxID=161536 RepID=UPI00064D7A55|nr:universal stress protein [Ornithinibacillus californiensis]